MEYQVRIGKIKDFNGHWMSGIASLAILDSETEQLEWIHCENASTVRALDACFGGIIQEGHSVSVEGIADQEIYWSLDDMGLIFESFTPVDDASQELIEFFENERLEVVTNDN